jgi:hypothetical protein
MSYPCYDHQLGCYLHSYSDRVAAEKRLGVVGLMKGETVKSKQPLKFDIKRSIYESMQRLKYDPSILAKAKLEAKKQKYEEMLKDYERGIYTFSATP